MTFRPEHGFYALSLPTTAGVCKQYALSGVQPQRGSIRLGVIRTVFMEGPAGLIKREQLLVDGGLLAIPR